MIATPRGKAILLGGGASFVGAYDAIPSIAAAYGMRRLRTAYTGNLLRLRRSSDNTEQNFGYVTNGDLDVAAIATFVGGGSGYVVTWHDQSGNGNNATQSTAAAQPLYVASAQNSKPTIRFDGTDDGYDLGDRSALYPTAATLLVVAANINDTNYEIYKSRGNDEYWRFSGASGDGYQGVFRLTRINNYPANPFMPSSGDAIFAIVSSASTFEIFKNGTGAGAQAAGYSAGNSHGIASQSGANANNWYNGDLAELVISASELSTANRNAAEAAMNAYWSVY